MNQVVTLIISLVFLLSSQGTNAQKNVTASDDTRWWVGITSMGQLMPVTDSYEADLNGNTYGNQVQPLLLSNHGEVIWSEKPFALKVRDGVVEIDQAKGEVIRYKAGTTLEEGYRYASENFFPPKGILPDKLLFSAPQYNTWIELMYDQNQEDILEYAHAIIDNGFPPGVLMIDDNWQEDYGKWNFHPGRFPDPKAMMEELHGMGFKVMLWVCPFVSADCDVYRDLASKGAFLVTNDHNTMVSDLPTEDLDGNMTPQMVSWWNGFSAVLDLSNPVADEWFKSELNRLQQEFSVDGFKLDAGDAGFYTIGVSKGKVSANTQAKLFGEVGLDYPLNEYRAMWKMGGQPLVRRLRDKGHTGEDRGKLVPSMLLQCLMGYYFNCPDMIGGGEFTSFLEDAIIDQELIVRSAQCHALMPMMQFSVAPWRILDEEHLEAVQVCVSLREKYSDYILEGEQETAETGIPFMRPMEFDFPHQGYARVNQQFLLGEKLLVAPVIEKGAATIMVSLPAGKWEYMNGKAYRGPKSVEVPVTLNDLPHFIKLK